MSESVLRYATRSSVALALAGVITGGTLVYAAVSQAASFVTGDILGGSRSRSEGSGNSGSPAHGAPGSGRGGPSGEIVVRPVIRGEARVIDGDTIDIAGTRVRLEGIDAPETGQTCARRFFLGTWRCGLVASQMLSGMVAGREVACESHGNDKYGRMLGICYADGADVNERMVRAGLAWAFIKYSSTYVEAEREARAARRGIFSTDNLPAWEFRANHWAGAQQQAPEGCAIKGNLSRHGHIYHMPWSPWYKRVSIDTARGDRWFCSESEAIAAGWRPAHGS